LLETNVRNEHSQVAPYLNVHAYRLLLGETHEALRAAREALRRAQGMEYPLYTAVAVQLIATIAALDGDVRNGARPCGFVDEVLRAEGVEREPTEQRIYEMLIQALRRRLSETEIKRFKTSGARLCDPRTRAPSGDIRYAALTSAPTGIIRCIRAA
jgi:hypothetical protein